MKSHRLRNAKKADSELQFTKRAYTDMRVFFHGTDWAALWEEFYTALAANGSFKWKNTRVFAAQHAESETQRLFIAWYIGPKDGDPPADARWNTYAQEGPQDWIKKRKSGGWFTDENIQRVSVEITRRFNALEALREAGNKYSIQFLNRGAQLAQQLDREFRGTLFGGGDPLANSKRAFLYLELHEKLLHYQKAAQELYANSHGVSFQDMTGLMRLVESAAMVAGQAIEGAGQQRKEVSMLAAFAEMTLSKSAKYGLPIPPEAEAKIVDAIAEHPVNGKPKKVVQ